MTAASLMAGVRQPDSPTPRPVMVDYEKDDPHDYVNADRGDAYSIGQLHDREQIIKTAEQEQVRYQIHHTPHNHPGKKPP